MNELDDRILRELIPRMRRFAISLTGQQGSADDLVQAALEKAMLNWHKRRPDGDLRAWLFAIQYRLFIDERRRSRRYSRLLEWFETKEAETSSTEDVVMAHAALDAIEQLPEEQRALLTLIAVEGMTYQDVSLTLDIPIGTVMSRLSRARSALRRITEGQIPRTTMRILK